MSKTREIELMELESELTTEDRLRRWWHRVKMAVLGQECPECVSRGLRIEELRGQLKEAGEKYSRLRDLRESEPVPKVTDVDIAVAYDSPLPEQAARWASEPLHQPAGPTNPPPALYRPPTALEAARRRHRVRETLENRAPTNQEIAARAAGGA